MSTTTRRHRRAQDFSADVVARPSPRHIERAERPASPRGVRLRILLIVSALIAYGSLYPFDFTVPGSAADAWGTLLHDWSMTTSRGDALGNLALFLPLGFIGVFAFPGRSPVAVMRLGLFSLFLAAVLQVAQIYFPPRTPAIADVMWNMMGACLGIAAGLVLRDSVRLRWQSWDRAYAVPLTLIVLWIAAELLPLVPSLDLQLIKESVKALLALHMSTPDIVWHAGGVLLAGRALTAIAGRSRALRWLAVLIVVVIAGKMLIVTRVLNASTLAGLVLGYGAWGVVSMRPSRDAVVVCALVIAYTLKALFPMTLRAVPADFNWLPFAGMLQGSMLINAQVLVESVFVFAGVLGLLRMLGSSVIASSVVLAFWAAALEAAQLYIVGRSPDITEPLLVLLVGNILQRAPASSARRYVH